MSARMRRALHTRRGQAASIFATTVLALSWMVLAPAPSLALTTLSQAMGFEAADGNLAANDAKGTLGGTADWNSFQSSSSSGGNVYTNMVNWSVDCTGVPDSSEGVSETGESCGAPYREATATQSLTSGVDPVSGWQFLGLEDAAASTSDSGFAGGVKQDQDCPSVIGSKAPNKADLARVYMAAKTSGGHTYLILSWVRIPQNTTSADSHVAFEFNQASENSNPCGAGADGLVHRTAGDLLVLYDFTGGGTPTISIARWITSTDTDSDSDASTCSLASPYSASCDSDHDWDSTTGPCGIGSDSPPCWSPNVTLAPSAAVAAVDDNLSMGCPDNFVDADNDGDAGGENDAASDTTTPDTSACPPAYAIPGTKKNPAPATIDDSLAPPSASTNCDPSCPASGTTAGVSEFGEAGIDLTAAGVFTAGSCETFGTADAVSRSSGSSGTAAMEDLVGPGNFDLNNCGEIKIIKHSDPRGINQNFCFAMSPTPAGATFSKSTGSDTDCDEVYGNDTDNDLTTPDSGTQFTLNDNGNTAESASVDVDDSTPSTCGGLARTEGDSCDTDSATPPDSAGNTEDITNVQPGSYMVSETEPSSAWTLESLSCTTSGPGNTGAQSGSTTTADITVAAGGTVTCTYQNQGTGAIQITKEGKDKNCASGDTTTAVDDADGTQIGTCSGTSHVAYLAATFAVTDAQGNSAGSISTDKTTGIGCLDGIPAGATYTVTETAAPSNFAAADPDSDGDSPGNDTDSLAGDDGYSVTVSSIATCSTGSPATQVVVDNPLTDVTVTAVGEIVGATSSTISCTDSNSNTVGSSSTSSGTTTDTADGLVPGTYTCTVTIDP